MRPALWEHGEMVDGRLSRAVVTYIWGNPRRLSYPSSHPDDVARTFGDGATDLLSSIERILDDEPLRAIGNHFA